MKRLLAVVLLAGSAVLVGCGDSEESFVAAAGGGGSTLPIARADSYTTPQGTALAVPAEMGVLVNDSVPGGPVRVAFPSVTTRGGQVTLGGDSGAFTYTPAQGFVGPDAFVYEVSNGFGTSRATVTIAVTLGVQGPGVFVDSVSGNDATGNFASGSPFASVQAAVTAAGPGGDIVVFPGRGTYTGTVNLLNGQRLLGFASGLVNAQGADRPTLSGPLVLADGNTVASVRVVRTDGIAIDGDDQVNGIITGCEVANSAGTGIQIRSIAGDWSIQDNTVSQTDGIGIDMDTQGDDVAVVRVNDNSITGSRLFGLGMAAFGQSRLTVQVNDNVLTDNLGLFSVLAISTGTSTLCVQILGNQNDSVYRFDRTSAQAALNVERFSELPTLNSGTVAVTQQPVTDVPAGFCGF